MTRTKYNTFWQEQNTILFDKNKIQYFHNITTKKMTCFFYCASWGRSIARQRRGRTPVKKEARMKAKRNKNVIKYLFYAYGRTTCCTTVLLSKEFHTIVRRRRRVCWSIDRWLPVDTVGICTPYLYLYSLLLTCNPNCCAGRFPESPYRSDGRGEEDRLPVPAITTEIWLIYDDSHLDYLSVLLRRWCCVDFLSVLFRRWCVVGSLLQKKEKVHTQRNHSQRNLFYTSSCPLRSLPCHASSSTTPRDKFSSKRSTTSEEQNHRIVLLDRWQCVTLPLRMCVEFVWWWNYPTSSSTAAFAVGRFLCK